MIFIGNQLPISFYLQTCTYVCIKKVTHNVCDVMNIMIYPGISKNCIAIFINRYNVWNITKIISWLKISLKVLIMWHRW